MRKIILISAIISVLLIEISILAGAAYSPANNLNVTLILKPKSVPASNLNVTLILGEGAIAPPVDTCTYSGSGTWNVNCSDNCVITSEVNLNGEYLFITGPGIFQANAAVRNYGYLFTSKGCATSGRFEP